MATPIEALKEILNMEAIFHVAVNGAGDQLTQAELIALIERAYDIAQQAVAEDAEANSIYDPIEDFNNVASRHHY